jgi:hypothetical protein
MQFGRIAGVQALCFASFYLCQQMKGGRQSGETDGLPPQGKPSKQAPKTKGAEAPLVIK